jgi:ribosomal protein S18 acetylase RimI-like enzyme
VNTPSGLEVRLATAVDAPALARLLHDFNREFGDPAPAVEWLTDRLGQLIETGEVTALLAGAGPDGLAVLRFRPSLWTAGLECYLAELYVVPARRGRGLGRALMDAVIELARSRGADHIELNTEETDRAARALYESLGFSNRHGGREGPISYYYEREL